MGRVRKVRAQRKYANNVQRSYTRCVPEPVEIPSAPQVVIKVNRPVREFLDLVALQNQVHNHDRMEVRVVLERLSPEDLRAAVRVQQQRRRPGAPATPQHDPPVLPELDPGVLLEPTTPPTVEPQSPVLIQHDRPVLRQLDHPPLRQRESPVLQQQESPVVPQRVPRARKRRSPSDDDRPLALAFGVDGTKRTRRLTRSKITQTTDEKKKTKGKTDKPVTKATSSPFSRSFTARKTLKKKKVSSLTKSGMQTRSQTKVKQTTKSRVLRARKERHKITKKIARKPPANAEFARTFETRRVSHDEPQIEIGDEPVDVMQVEPQEDTVDVLDTYYWTFEPQDAIEDFSLTFESSPDETQVEPEDYVVDFSRTQEDCDDDKADESKEEQQEESQDEPQDIDVDFARTFEPQKDDPPDEPQDEPQDETQDVSESAEPRPNNSLSGFVENIFNWKYSNVGCAEADVDDYVADSVTRVQDWLEQNNEHENRFKVPEVPPMRSRRSGTGPKTCLFSNYKYICQMMTNKNMVMDICGTCERCDIALKRQWRSSHLDNIAFKTVLKNMSKKEDHVHSLKKILTEVGRMFIECALLLQKKCNKYTPREQCLFAEVVSILHSLNPDTAAAKSIPAEPTTSRLSTDIYVPSEVVPLNDLRGAPVLRPSWTKFNEGPGVFLTTALQACSAAGICGVVPPLEFKPHCQQNDKADANFKISNQYIYRTLSRWGSTTRDLTAIRSVQNPKIQKSPPLLHGLEVDLPLLFKIVQQDGGIQVLQNDHNKWKNVAKKMNLNVGNQDAKKLQIIYLKYLLDYNSLTPEEREKVTQDVEKCWAEREMKAVARAQDPLWRQDRMMAGLPLDDETEQSHLETVCAEVEECVTNGRSLNITQFKKLAEKVLENHFPDTTNPTPETVEQKYWSIVVDANSHVCVHAASVDATEHGCGFTTDRSDRHGNHPWNLKRVRASSTNLLSHLGPCVGVSSSSIQYGMALTTSCWHMDPTAVPWIEYLHKGPPKIWYTITADQENKFRAAAEALCPYAVQNKEIWLPSDIVMMPPNLLRAYGVKVNRHVQNEGEYVIVYPNTYCASINTGFTISEGVYFAPHGWIKNIETIFVSLRNSCEPSLFAIEALLIAMANNERTPLSMLQRVHTVLTGLLRTELLNRQRMADRNIELMTPEVFLEQNPRASRSSWQIQQNGECAYCRRHLFLSRVVGVAKTGLCAIHGVVLFEKAVARHEQLSNVYCVIMVSNTEIYKIIKTITNRIMGSIHTPV